MLETTNVRCTPNAVKAVSARRKNFCNADFSTPARIAYVAFTTVHAYFSLSRVTWPGPPTYGTARQQSINRPQCDLHPPDHSEMVTSTNVNSLNQHSTL